MWSTPCPHEASARRMVREGRGDAAVRAHAIGCDDCRDTIEVVAALRRLEARPLPAAPGTLPSASYLWWKAELLRRWDAEQRAVEPVDIGERIGAGLGVVGVVATILWLWRRADFALPSVFHLGGAGFTHRGVVAITLVFCVLVLGATAMALLDAGRPDRKG